MSRNAQRRKIGISWALAVVLVVDAGLVFVNWRASAADPRALQQQRNEAQWQRDLLAADVRRAQEIEKRLPEVKRECDQFFTNELRDASSGYSSIVGDLGRIAKNASLRTDSITFRQHELANRGVVEVEVATTVEGDYPSLVSFINGLERSHNFYLLDSLQLASSTGGSLKLNLQLRTYFRS
jgi:outer membrane cobalamin receptor